MGGSILIRSGFELASLSLSLEYCIYIADGVGPSCWGEALNRSTGNFRPAQQYMLICVVMRLTTGWFGFIGILTVLLGSFNSN